MAALLILLVGVIGFTFSSLDISDNAASPEPYQCEVTEEGDIFADLNTDCKGTDSGGEIQINKISKNSDTEFWIPVKSIFDGSREEAAAPSKFLIEQGYVTNQDEEYRNIKMRNDINSSDKVLRSLERGTACTADIRVHSTEYVTYKYGKDGENSKEYDMHHSDDEAHDIDDLFPNQVSIESDEVRIERGDYYSTFCKFDIEKLMNKGAEHSPFYSIALTGGGELAFYGDDYDEGETDIRIDYGLDTDGDGVNDDSDSCPRTAGDRSNGCPIEEETEEPIEENTTEDDSKPVNDNDEVERESVNIFEALINFLTFWK